MDLFANWAKLPKMLKTSVGHIEYSNGCLRLVVGEQLDDRKRDGMTPSYAWQAEIGSKYSATPVNGKL